MRIQTLQREEVFETLGTSANGLTDEEAKIRLQKYGPNEIPKLRKTPIFIRFLTQFKNLFAVLLIIASILAAISNMPELSIAIILIVLINAVVGFLQEYRAEKTSEALKKLVPFYAKVIRDGEQKKISAHELVPGDLIVLESGDKIPADARLVEAYEITVNNMALTGESEPRLRDSYPVIEENVPTADISNFVLMGTSIASGSGKAVIFGTGMNTEFGTIAKMTQVIKEEPSPLQKEIAQVAKRVAAVSVSIGSIFFLIGLLIGISPLEAAIFGIGVVAALIPEGLQATVSVSLAMGVQKMARHNALIKRLSAVETLGSTTVICTDKTGTITKGEMTVSKIWINNRLIDVTGVGYEPYGSFMLNQNKISAKDVAGLELLLEASTFCNTAKLAPPSDVKRLWTAIGDPTEAALLVVAQKADFNVQEALAERPCIQIIPFDSVRKRMSSIHRSDEGKIAYVKGAPYEILSISTKIVLDGVVQKLHAEQMLEINTQVDDLAKTGLRVLAVAYRVLPEDLEEFTVESVEKDLVFIGLVAMLDPPRPEVREAVMKAKRAGIKVIMITGDYGLTALAIASDVGIAEPDRCKIIQGVEIDELTDDQLSKELNREEIIFARASPEHKLRIVALLKKKGEVVAVTGDGVNDAPSLKMADIGVAMGMIGTDVARESADMILLDDSFATIVTAIEEGRAVYGNIKRFLTYIFSHNWAELVPFLLFVLLKIPLPLLVIQILAVDLGTDVLPSLALGAEQPEPGVMGKPPRSRKERLLSLSLLGRSFFLGSFVSLGSMAGCLWAWSLGGWSLGQSLASDNPVYRKGTTMTFTGIVATQVGNVFACRTDRTSIFKVGFLSNKWVWVGIAGELLLTSAIVYLAPLQAVFKTAPLGLIDWMFLFMFAPILLFGEEIRKYFLRRR